MNEIDWVKAWSKALGAGFAAVGTTLPGVVVAPAGIGRRVCVIGVIVGFFTATLVTLSAQLSNPNKDTSTTPPVVVNTTPMVEAVLAAIAPHLPQVATPAVTPLAATATEAPLPAVLAQTPPASAPTPAPELAAGVAVPMPAAAPVSYTGPAPTEVTA